MSVSYTSTSFGAPQTGSGTARHAQRHSSGSSHSSTTFASPVPASAQALPLPATAAHSPTRPSYNESAMRMQYEAIGHFFGGGRRSEYTLSRDRAESNSNPPPRSGRDRSGSTSTTALPPSYDAHTEVESLPTYTKVEEYDAKWNRKLFWYGFFFFPLWILGIVSPFVKPNRDPARDNRTKEDQEEDYANMRKAEIRWAWRCAVALLGLAILVTVAVVVGVTVSANE